MATYAGIWGVTTRTLEAYFKEYEAIGALVKRDNHVVTLMQDLQHSKDDFKRLKELSEGTE